MNARGLFSRRRTPTTGVAHRLLPILAMVAAGCGASPAGQAAATPLPVVPDVSGITAEGRLEPVRFVTMAAAAEGHISEIAVAEGATVQSGELIARLDSTEVTTLEAAQAGSAVAMGDALQALRTAQREFDEYPVPREFVGMTPEEAAASWLAELQAAREAFAPYKDTSRKTYKPNHFFPHLPRIVLLDTQEYEGVAKEYKKRVDVAWANYTKAVQWLQAASAVETAKADLALAETRSSQLQLVSGSDAGSGTRAALATGEIRAPFDGIVTNLDLKLGEAVLPGQAMATVADFGSWVVKTTNLTEIDVVDVQVGEPATVAIDALPSKTFEGRVTSIAQNYAERQGDVVYTTTIALADEDPEMRWGMTVQITFEH
jgi:multidrug resistance efflux pump